MYNFRVCCIKDQEPSRDSKGSTLDESEPLSVIGQHVTGSESVLWLTHCRVHQPLAEKGRAHIFQIISQLIGQAQLNCSRCVTQGVIITIRKMVTLRHAHLPRVLMNGILSPVSLQPINSWGCQSNGRAADKYLGLVCSGWKGTYFSPSFFFHIFFQKKKKSESIRWS